MSQASQVSRYRPAVIAITGVAAAFGIWTLYSTFSDRTSKGPLHRSNAVRRTRRTSVGGPSVETSGPTAEEPFGSVVITRNGLAVGRIVFGLNRIPSPEEWRALYGGSAEHARSCIARIALASVTTQSPTRLVSSQQMFQEARDALSSLGSEEIGNAIASDVSIMAHTQLLGALLVMGIQDIDINRPDGDFVVGPAHHAPVDETDAGDILDGNHAAEPAQGLKGLLYYIAEEKAKREAYEHRGIRCDSCNESPIRGIRWHCLNCPDIDLCSMCEASFTHQQTHVFVKVKIPLPAVGQPGRSLSYPVWYSGNPHIIHQPISPALRKRLAEKYHYEESQIDALYDQFITTANISYTEDPSGIKIGIDRRAFDSALTIEAWTERSRPNALYDRMFAFYDRGNKGAILFEDFIDGMAYLRGSSRLQPLDRALQGFDFDGDGYVSRGDFISLMRAKYEVQKALIVGASSIRADRISQEGADVLKSSQPISAIFCEQDMPPGELRAIGGKQRDSVGDLQPSDGIKAILEDDELPAGSMVSNVIRVRSLPQLQRQLARLDRALHRSDEATAVDSEAGQAPQERTDSLAGALSAEEAATLGLSNNAPADNAENGVDSTHQDILWKYTEMSYHELLDPIFKAREESDRQVTETADERRRWRKEIDDAVEQKKIMEEQLRSDAELDPLVAAAADARDRSSSAWIRSQDTPERRAAEVQREIDIMMRDNILPTDAPSLDKFEEEIKEQSLDELLAAAGYSIDGAGEDETQEAMDSTPAAEAPGTSAAGQNSSSPVSKDDDTSTPPTQERLQDLAALDEEANLIEARGGAGRLAYKDLIAMAEADREVRGLITCWLELASF
jgi:Ca2+-binding EF-hand superfamily protein